MEFRTSQGGTTTLHLDEGERLQLEDLAKRNHLTTDDAAHRLVLTRQAQPLADFDGLLMLAFPQNFRSPMEPHLKVKKQSRADPLDDLERGIRRRLDRMMETPIGSTSQTMQVEATLLQALATVLQTRELRRLAEVEDA